MSESESIKNFLHDVNKKKGVVSCGWCGGDAVLKKAKTGGYYTFCKACKTKSKKKNSDNLLKKLPEKNNGDKESLDSVTDSVTDKEMEGEDEIMGVENDFVDKNVDDEVEMEVAKKTEGGVKSSVFKAFLAVSAVVAGIVFFK